MKDIQSYLKRGDIEATLLNDHDESFYLGPASTVKPLKDKHSFKFNITGQMNNISPFDRVALHLGSEVIDVIYTKPFFQEGRTVIQFDYGRET